MGQPAGSVITRQWAPANKDWRYPEMRQTLPPHLKTLVLGIDPTHRPYNTGYEEVLLSALLSKIDTSTETEDLLDTVRLYGVLNHVKDLPMEFWEMKNRHELLGRGFEHQTDAHFSRFKSTNPQSLNDVHSVVVSRTTKTSR
jgi:hypothetical protein